MSKSTGTKKSNRLQEQYCSAIRPNLQKRLELDNVMSVPRLVKIVVNVGVKEAVSNSKAIKAVAQVVEAVTGQTPVTTAARKSVAGFKIREGMNIGVKVTLRGARMYAFLDKLINLSLPRVRDFQGVGRKLDGRGNYNLGVQDWAIFPEAESAGAGEWSHGLNITVHTTAVVDEHGYALLEELGMPFRKKQ